MAQMVCPETGMKFTIKNVVAHANTFEYRRRIPADIQAHYNGKKWISRTMGRMGNMHAVMIAAEQLDGFYDAEIDAHRNGDAKRVADKPDARHLAFFGTNVSSEVADIYFKRADQARRLENVFDHDQATFDLMTSEERAIVEGKTTLLKALEEDEARKTLRKDKHRRAGVEQFVKVVGDIAVEDLTRENVRTFIKARQDAGDAGTTIVRRIGAVKAMVNRYYLEQDRDAPKSLWIKHDIENGSASEEDRIALKPDVIKQIDGFMRGQQIVDSETPRTLAIYWLIRCSSLGPSEACGLMRDDVILDDPHPHVIIRNNTIRPMKTKSRRRVFPLVGEALKHAGHLATETFDGDNIGNRLNILIKRAVPTLEKRRESLYSLRHNFKDAIYQAGANANESRYLMGHASKSSHDRYGSGPGLARNAELVTKAVVY